MQMLPDPTLYRSRIRYTLAESDGQTYDLVSAISLRMDQGVGAVIATIQPDAGQFRIGAIGVLLADMRTVYVEAMQYKSLPRVSDVVVLELVEAPDPADVVWMKQQAASLGIELVVRFAVPGAAAP